MRWMLWRHEDVKLTRAQITEMRTEELYAKYKAGAAYFRALNDWCALARETLAARNEIKAKQAELEATKAKLASSAGKGGF